MIDRVYMKFIKEDMFEQIAKVVPIHFAVICVNSVGQPQVVHLPRLEAQISNKVIKNK